MKEYWAARRMEVEERTRRASSAQLRQVYGSLADHYRALERQSHQTALKIGRQEESRFVNQAA